MNNQAFLYSPLVISLAFGSSLLLFIDVFFLFFSLPTEILQIEIDILVVSYTEISLRHYNP